MHVALVAFDFFFAALVIFPAAFHNTLMAELYAGILPGVGLCLVASRVLAPARVAVLRQQRTASVAFAGSALRGTLGALMLQSLVVARFAAFAVKYPAGLFTGDCEFKVGDSSSHIRSHSFHFNMDLNNDTWLHSAPIDTCVPDLFIDADSATNSKANVYHHHVPIWYQFHCSLVIVYYLLMGCFLYFAARGQGLLHDKLFSELDMEPNHIIALNLWLLATFGAVASLAVMWAEWTDRGFSISLPLLIHVCTGVGLLGMMAVLWKEALLSALGLGDTSAEKRSAKHIVFASMRFVNGQTLPEAIQLREALKKRNVHLKIVELTAGADINHEVFESIEQAEAFLVFGTSNYGEKTANPACTYFESEYARNSGKKVILLRMIPWEGASFEHTQARVMFGMNDLALSWMEGTPMPEDLPNDIIAALPNSL